MKLKRNDLCYCGSGQKYKKCHMNLDAGWFYNAKTNSWSKPTQEDKMREEVEKLVAEGKIIIPKQGEVLPVANMGKEEKV